MRNNIIALLVLALIAVSITAFFINSRSITFITGLAGSGGSSTAFNLTEEISILVTNGVDFGLGRVYPNASFAILDSELGINYPKDYVGWWRFDSANGSNSTFAPDEAGLHNGNVRNGTVTSGISGQAYNFNGADGAINLAGSSNAFNVSSKTISFWANPVQMSDHNSAVFSRYNLADLSIYIQWGNNRIGVSWKNSTGDQKIKEIGPINSVSYGSWAHYAVVFNVTGNTVNITVYKNGSEIGSYQNNEGYSLTSGSNGNFIIGAVANTTNVFNGSLDEVFFYNRSLSSAEVSSLYEFQGNFSGCINGTWYFPMSYFTVENDGTVNITVYFHSDKNAGQFIGGTDPSFMIKGVVSETGSCQGLGEDYSEVPNETEDPVGICSLLKFQNNADAFNVPVQLYVPSDVPAGPKNATITFTASRYEPVIR